MTDLPKASQFLDTHARLIDRRRFAFLFAGGAPEGVVDALRGYLNRDGGAGWGLEPDLRGPASQPAGALHALETLAEVGPLTDPMAARLCDWLASASLADGGLPFALPGSGGPGSAPHWAGADHSRSSLHITSAVCWAAHRVAAHDAAVAAHPWLARATAYCRERIAALDAPGGAYELLYVLRLLDLLHDREAWAAEESARLGAFLPRSGVLAVAGGVEGEALRPLDLSPEPGRPLRDLVSSEAVAGDLDRLAAGQREDGGWEVGFPAFSPGAAIEWRGSETVRALTVLAANGRLDAGAPAPLTRSAPAPTAPG